MVAPEGLAGQVRYSIWWREARGKNTSTFKRDSSAKPVPAETVETKIGAAPFRFSLRLKNGSCSRVSD